MNRLEGVYRERLQAKDEQIEQYKRENTNLWELAKLGATRPINNIAEATAMADKDNITFSGNTIYGSAGHIEGGNITNINLPQDLANAAKEIQDLLEELEKSNPTTTTSEQMAVATEAIKQIEKDPTLRERVIGAAKGGALEALKQTLIGKIVASAIEGWTKVN